jgi:hypothetical protein
MILILVVPIAYEDEAVKCAEFEVGEAAGGCRRIRCLTQRFQELYNLKQSLSEFVVRGHSIWPTDYFLCTQNCTAARRIRAAMKNIYRG